MRERLPIHKGVFLTHGEESGLTGMASRLSAFLPPDRIVVPELDDAFDLGPSGARLAQLNERKRLLPGKVARLDWHNDLSELLLDVSQAVSEQADERRRAAVIRRLRRALTLPDRN